MEEVNEKEGNKSKWGFDVTDLLEKEGNKSKWGFDVTDLLRNFVAEELNDLQPMLHNDSFSLLESMSAIEARICICTKSIDISR